MSVKLLTEQLRAVYFIPFDGSQWRVEDRVQVVEDGVKNFQREGGLKYPAEPYRFQDRLVWVTDSSLHSFDLKTRERKAIKLFGVQWHPSYRVTAFDGHTVVCGVFTFDSTTGKLLGEPDYRKRPRHAVFAVRNQIGYYYDSGQLRAIDLTSTVGANIPVNKALTIVPMQCDEGLTIWDGQEWAHVPWLSELHLP